MQKTFFEQLKDHLRKILRNNHIPRADNLEERRQDEEMRFQQKKHPSDPTQKVLERSGGQDISAI